MAMVLEIIGILAVVVFIGFLINGIEDYNKRTIPFLEFEKVEYPIVEFVNEGKKLTFMIDSGSNMSFISNDALHSVEHTPANYTMEVSGIENNQETVSFYNVGFNYKSNSFVNTFGAKDIDFTTIKENTGYSIDGIIGSLFLDKYGIIIDYNNHRLMITK